MPGRWILMTLVTEEANKSRSKNEEHLNWSVQCVLSDVPSDLVIHINNIRYRLHKTIEIAASPLSAIRRERKKDHFPLLLKCGLLQRLCSDSEDPAVEATPVALHDIPGGEEAFELCAKFSYGITISLSAHNFVPAICAAKFLRMTEAVSKGNFVMKLEAFFETCILQGWKDSIVALQSTRKIVGWSENLGIVHRCVETIVDKILTHPSKVSWSYTYTRPGYSGKQHRSVPRDWWTEDVSELDLEHFRTIISAIRSAKEIPPPLVGEALHVYACKHLPDPSEAQKPESSDPTAEEALAGQRRVLESIVSMIPIDHGSVSGSFLLRLLRIATLVGASPSAKAELVRRSGRQLHEARVKDLLFPSPSNPKSYDIDLVEAILENFLAQFRRHAPRADAERAVISMRTVAHAIDSYLQVVAKCASTPVSRFVDLAEALPEVARPEHDDLYRAIDTYLKEHPELSKEEKKQLCRMIDCRKLSAEARAHAIRNDRLPLRTIVQVLFVEQERAAGAGDRQDSPRHEENNLQGGVHEHAKYILEDAEHNGETKSAEPKGRREKATALGRARSMVGRMGRSRSGAEGRTGREEVEITEDGLGNRFKA
ncbi:hypothetical protein Taro_036672 [Colocasia esculenta]|uniref:NPH3 domain-containing protein n=1 Tax=Colocasia esculenta TaxID=4460 RepID=A0A843VY70_COLES|nr:hypothetical protein [Colocasia esculenta]